jgi:hypothetical protein
MNGAKTQRAPIWFWIAVLLGLGWNLFGVYMYMLQVYENPALTTALTEAKQVLQDVKPSWVIGAFAIAVFAGTLGTIGLLIRRRWAKFLLVLSLLAVLAQESWVLLFSDKLAVEGMNSAILPITIIVIALILVWLANHAGKRGWLR